MESLFAYDSTMRTERDCFHVIISFGYSDNSEATLYDNMEYVWCYCDNIMDNNYVPGLAKLGLGYDLVGLYLEGEYSYQGS